MKHAPILFLFLLNFTVCLPVWAQTAGSGTVSAIEAKAKQISNNDTQVSDLNRQHLASYSEEQNKFYQLKVELDALLKEKAQAMAEMRRGEFCNGCDRTATQLRNSGRSRTNSAKRGISLLKR